jgi:hypothetical protein
MKYLLVVFKSKKEQMDSVKFLVSQYQKTDPDDYDTRAQLRKDIISQCEIHMQDMMSKVESFKKETDPKVAILAQNITLLLSKLSILMYLLRKMNYDETMYKQMIDMLGRADETTRLIYETINSVTK